MGMTFAETPLPFGSVHLTILAVIALLLIPLFLLLRRKEERGLERLIFIVSAFMIVMEIWKQWFVPRYVYVDILSAWFFPWQLCSMAMYCGILLPLSRGRYRDGLLVFLSSYNIVAALGALIFPYDMMRPQILLFYHSFIYHGLMLVLSLAAILILVKKPRPSFIPALILFYVMAVIAEVINVLSHYIVGETGMQANMFNITPYYPSTQPVFHDIAVKLGIVPEILIYLAFISLLSYGLYRLIFLCNAKKKKAG